MTSFSKRERLIQAATELFYTKGILSTSLKDIADKAEIPLGNVYYYFKTKDDLGLATASEQMKRLYKLIDQLEAQSTNPVTRICGSIKFFDKIKDNFVKYGCPIAGVCQALDSNQNLVAISYAKVFYDYLAWLESNFKKMGYNAIQSHNHALHVLVIIQGAGIMAKSMNNASIISEQVKALCSWVKLHI